MLDGGYHGQEALSSPVAGQRSSVGLPVVGVEGLVVVKGYLFGGDCLSGSVGYFVGVKGAILGEVAGLWKIILDIIVLPFGVGVRVDGVLEVELLFPFEEVEDSLAVTDRVSVVLAG